MRQESTRFESDGFQVSMPHFMEEIVAEITHLARRSPDISQRSGVSVRVSICNYENVVSNAIRRAIRVDEQLVAPRISDLTAIMASTAGKIEMETMGDGREDKIIDRLVQGAVQAVFNRYFALEELEDLTGNFDRGL